ncbi:unnamed protein product [Ranitomeya imitator]|uniref:Uncharacterized protein n=1 Tax=Ranitomeya imitator TaxID=111125 RepID=A0ABN9LMQ7_9NEOB|nr:unnamed protein product [Ranitomeya imitator]
MTNEYFSKLLEIGNTQAVFNYLKSLKPFLDYTKNSTDLIHKDKKVYDALCIFVDQLGYIGGFSTALQNAVDKPLMTKEMFERWNSDSKRARKHPDRCKTYFYARLKAGKRGKSTCGRKIDNSSIDEWKDRIPKSDHVGITVYEHKTAANQVATVILTKEEESWFDIYFEKIWIEAR